jgi:hypothetical protein
VLSDASRSYLTSHYTSAYGQSWNALRTGSGVLNVYKASEEDDSDTLIHTLLKPALIAANHQNESASILQLVIGSEFDTLIKETSFDEVAVLAVAGTQILPPPQLPEQVPALAALDEAVRSHLPTSL